MDIESFQQLSTVDIARLVRETGPLVCGLPINGTRRWFGLEYPDLTDLSAYLQITGQKHLDVYRLMFDHGVDTLLTPVFGPDLLERGDEYLKLAELGLAWFAQEPAFLDFYEAYDVHVRVYGDVARWLSGARYAPLRQIFDDLTRRTAQHRRHRLFFGVCAHDPAETVAAIGAQFQRDQLRLPDKREIVEAYYGEYVAPLNFFIGFDRPTLFDMPLIATGNEDLYFTVSPSLYLDAPTLRSILYDHLYARRVSDDYADFSAQDWQTLGEFYRVNRRHVLGVGQALINQHVWCPLPQVIWPD